MLDVYTHIGIMRKLKCDMKGDFPHLTMLISSKNQKAPLHLQKTTKTPSPLSKSCYFWDSKGAFFSYRILGTERSQKCNLSFLSFPQIFLWKIWNSFTWNQCIEKCTKIFEKIEKKSIFAWFFEILRFWSKFLKNSKKMWVLNFLQKIF